MFSDKIKMLRQERHMSQSELAKILGVSKQSISNWESNNIAPSIDQIMKIAKFFHVSVDFIVGVDDRVMIDVTDFDEKAISFIYQVIGYLDNMDKKV